MEARGLERSAHQQQLSSKDQGIEASALFTKQLDTFYILIKSQTRTQRLAYVSTEKLAALLVAHVDELDDMRALLGTCVVEVEVDDVDGSLREVDGGTDGKSENEANTLVDGTTVLSEFAEERVRWLVGRWPNESSGPSSQVADDILGPSQTESA